MSSALTTVSAGCLLTQLMFCGMAAPPGLLPIWPAGGGQAEEQVPVVLSHAVTDVSRAAPWAKYRPMVRSVSIPPAPSAGADPAAPSLPAVLRTPAGVGPFPAVVLLHDCTGPFNGMPDWAYRLNAWGYAALMPDSLTPRGVRAVCDPGNKAKVTPRDRVADVAASVAWLRAREDIDANRIAVLGLSHGGVTAVLATETAYPAMRLRAAIDYHGPCLNPQLHGSVPLLVLAGEADDWNNPAARCRAYGAALGPGQPFEIHTYPGAYHGFDGGAVSRAVSDDHVIAFDRTAAEDSFAQVRGFLDRVVKN